MKEYRQVWFNGIFVPEYEARVSIYDSALMFGDVVFEMTRTFLKQHFKLREHLERLYRSAKFIGIDIKMSVKELEDCCLLTVEKNDPLFNEDD